MSLALQHPDLIQSNRDLAANWFRSLRNEICTVFEKIDGGGTFQRKQWERPGGGGGEMSVMCGNVFEKVGVNISTVHGKLPSVLKEEMPDLPENADFWASGISLVAHMRSPHIPAVHFNTRHIYFGERSWFGGGADLNPAFPVKEDTRFFHHIFKQACDKHNPSYYEKFSKWCDEYFYIAHRQEPRGVGGIFYDRLNSGNWENDFAFTKDVGQAFIDAYAPIALKNKSRTWTEDEREALLVKRGHYAEFNLVYDRGTKFGFMTGGNTEAILMSLPPEAKWPSPFDKKYENNFKNQQRNENEETTSHNHNHSCGNVCSGQCKRGGHAS